MRKDLKKVFDDLDRKIFDLPVNDSKGYRYTISSLIETVFEMSTKDKTALDLLTLVLDALNNIYFTSIAHHTDNFIDYLVIIAEYIQLLEKEVDQQWQSLY